MTTVSAHVEGLPDDVSDFVYRVIDSVAELEALLLLRATAPIGWQATDLARRLYIGDAAASTVIDALRRKHLASLSDDGIRYAPADDKLASEVDRLAASYPRYLISITRLIHGKPAPSLRSFSDAFRLRDKE